MTAPASSSLLLLLLRLRLRLWLWRRPRLLWRLLWLCFFLDLLLCRRFLWSRLDELCFLCLRLRDGDREPLDDRERRRLSWRRRPLMAAGSPERVYVCYSGVCGRCCVVQRVANAHVGEFRHMATRWGCARQNVNLAIKVSVVGACDVQCATRRGFGSDSDRVIMC